MRVEELRALLDVQTAQNPEKLVEMLNAIEISEDELSVVLSASKALHRDDPEAAGDRLDLPVRGRMPLEANKVAAIFFRMSALARLIDTHQTDVWATAADEEGASYARQELLQAAAMYPLSIIDDEIGFDREGLLAKALELADARRPC